VSATIRPNATAFVLDLGSNGLGVVRNLGREGVPVFGVDFKSKAPGLKSRYCKPLVAPDPLAQPDAALEFLLAQGRGLSDKGILYPTSDEYVLFVSRFRKQLERNFLFAMPSEEVIESILNKRKQYELAEEVGTPFPKTYYPESEQDIQKIKDQLEYPAFIKPYCSHIWRETFRNKGFKVNSASELVHRFRAVSDVKLQAMIQSIVTGPDSNIVEVYGYLSRKHEPLAVFVSRKLRQYPNHFGVSTCSESIHDEDATVTALKFYRDIKYRGIGHIELKRDDRDGKYKLLELNARTPPSNTLPTQAGINFPLIQYMELTNQRIEQINDYLDGIKWLDAVLDSLSFFELYKNGNLSPRQWLNSLRHIDCHAYYARDDWSPFLKEYLNKFARLPRYMLGYRG